MVRNNGMLLISALVAFATVPLVAMMPMGRINRDAEIADIMRRLEAGEGIGDAEFALLAETGFFDEQAPPPSPVAQPPVAPQPQPPAVAWGVQRDEDLDGVLQRVASGMGTATELERLMQLGYFDEPVVAPQPPVPVPAAGGLEYVLAQARETAQDRPRAGAGWQVNDAHGLHRRLQRTCPGFEVIQLKAVPQEQSMCGLHAAINTGALASAFQLLGPRGLNSEVISHLSQANAVRCEGALMPDVQAAIRGGQPADIAELEGAIRALHAPGGQLPIQTGYAVLDIENIPDIGGVGPNFSAVWEGGAAQPPIVYQSPWDLMAVEGADGNFNEAARMIVERSLRNAGFVNFIVNAGDGHWLAVSAIRRGAGMAPLLIVLDSLDDTSPEDFADLGMTQQQEALAYICELVAPFMR